MSASVSTLHLLCGKMASGKSTVAAALARPEGTVLISQDDWLQALFEDQLTSGADYLRCSTRLCGAMGPHVVALLREGLSVVLDFPANTVEARQWMRGLFEAAGASHRLHLMTTPDDICLTRLHARNAQGDHPFAPTEAQFHQFSRHFVEPSPEEGFTVVQHER